MRIWGRLAEHAPIEIEQISCPSCKEGQLRRINGKKDAFWGCSRYKEGCSATFQDNKGQPVLEAKSRTQRNKTVISDLHQCTDCGAGLIRRESTKKPGAFWWGCSGFPKCENTWFDNDGHPQGLESR